MQVHPHIVALVAAQHVRDMQVQATRARRVREARRARRGAAAAVPGGSVPRAAIKAVRAADPARSVGERACCAPAGRAA